MTSSEPSLYTFAFVAVTVVSEDWVMQQFAGYRAEKIGEIGIEHVGIQMIHFRL